MVAYVFGFSIKALLAMKRKWELGSPQLGKKQNRTHKNKHSRAI